MYPALATAILRPPVMDRLLDYALPLRPTGVWPLDEASGNLRDISGSGLTATLTGSPTYGTIAPSVIGGRGITFSGTAQYATTSAPTNSTSRMSVVAAFKTTDSTAAIRTIVARYAGSSQESWSLFLNTSHVPVVQFYQAGASLYAQTNTGIAANDGQWHLSGASLDTSLASLPINMAFDRFLNRGGTPSGSWNGASTAGITIASRATSNLWTGAIGIVLYWHDTALTTGQLREMGQIFTGG